MSKKGLLEMVTSELSGRRRSLANANRKKPWRIENATADEADLYVYDIISPWGVDPAAFVKELRAITASTINVHINSSGGDFFGAVAMKEALIRHPAKVVSYVDGLAASAASVVALAGDEIIMARGSFIMIHRATTFEHGTAPDFRRVAEVLDQVDASLAAMYTERLDLSAEEVLELLDAETWYGADEAVENGLADAVMERQAVAAQFDLSQYRNLPEGLKQLAARGSAGERPGSLRDFETFLRDAGGFSRAEAKQIAASGFKPVDARESTPAATSDDLLPFADLAGGILTLSQRKTA